jgi:hypothetical protein
MGVSVKGNKKDLVSALMDSLGVIGNGMDYFRLVPVVLN